MSPTPSRIQLHKKSKTLELQFGDLSYNLSAEFLRVHSPSAEVRGHGSESAVLQYGKAQVAINTLEPAGNYGVRIFLTIITAVVSTLGPSSMSSRQLKTN